MPTSLLTSNNEYSAEADDLKTVHSPLVSYSMFESNPQVYRFIQEMNKNARQLDMTNTHFDSPHGLANK